MLSGSRTRWAVPRHAPNDRMNWSAWPVSLASRVGTHEQLHRVRLQTKKEGYWPWMRRLLSA